MYDEKWEQTFLLLQDFVKEHGRFPTARESYQGVNIGRWYVYQRNKMQSSTLPPEQLGRIIISSCCSLSRNTAACLKRGRAIRASESVIGAPPRNKQSKNRTFPPTAEYCSRKSACLRSIPIHAGQEPAFCG